MTDKSESGVPRFTMEVVVALTTGALGAIICYGAIEAGIGWGDMGPDSGYFPFYIGILLMIGSFANLVFGFIKYARTNETFVLTSQLKPVLGFGLPLIAYAIVSAFLGLYVGTALYIAGAMIFQGKYQWWKALLMGLTVSIFFYLMFEMAFKVPLQKGPVEALFGIY